MKNISVLENNNIIEKYFLTIKHLKEKNYEIHC